MVTPVRLLPDAQDQLALFDLDVSFAAKLRDFPAVERAAVEERASIRGRFP